MSDTKRIILTELTSLKGKPFLDLELDDNGEPIRDLMMDSDGKPIMAVPRDERGLPIPDTLPEPVYKFRTKSLGKESLLRLLENFYYKIPVNRLTTQDTIYGKRMFDSIRASENGILELDSDIHKWIRAKLQSGAEAKDDKEGNMLGILIFGHDLAVVEDALDNFERPHEPKAAYSKEE